MSQVGANLKVFYGTVGGTPSTELANVTNVDFPEISASDVKNTHYSTPNQTHDYLPGYTEAGEIVITKDFLKADETTLRGLYKSRQKWKFQIVGDEAGDYQCEGYINKIGPSLPVDDKLTQKISVKVCTLPVWTAGTGA